MTKRCPHCKQDKDVSEFSVSGATGRPTSWCKLCSNTARKASFRKNPQRQRDYKRERKETVRRIRAEYKTFCHFCGESDSVCLDFHHVNAAEKKFNVSKADDVSHNRLIEEIKKCVCVCANCHRKLHAGHLSLQA